MESQKHERFLAANEELRDFLRRAEGLTAGTSTISEGDLKALSRRLSNLAPEVGDASHGETLDASLRNEVAEYVNNLRALQVSLEKIRCVMLTRKMQIEAERDHLGGLQDWFSAYHQTT
jgi:hypothetical protein